MLVHFIVLVGLWFFREPRFMPGWGDYFVETEVECGREKHNQIVEDASSAMFIVLLLIIVFSTIPFFVFLCRL